MGKTLAQVVFVALSLLFAIACSDQTKACGAAGCFDGIRVGLQPDVGSAYDADVVLDGVAGSFTCTESNGGWTLTNSTGSVPVDGCTDAEFSIEATPDSVEIAVDAHDGSWMGTVNASPSYEALEPNGPGCAPVCQVGELIVPQQ